MKPDVPALLRQYGLRPDKSLGQNFLLDDAALRHVADAAEIHPGDTVLEVGPGLGSLTVLLSGQARQVVAVEIDRDLIPPLRRVLADCDNVRLVQGDILALNPADLVDEPGYLVVANIPYYITSALMRHLLEARLPPRRLVLTVQREVAERICAEPGDMSLLALSVQVYGEAYITGQIPAEAFYPPPKVDSAVLRVDLFAEPLFPGPLLKPFFTLIKAGFSQKRKTLRNALAGGLGWKNTRVDLLLAQAQVDPMRRAETLGFAEWQRLVQAYTIEK